MTGGQIFGIGAGMFLVPLALYLYFMSVREIVRCHKDIGGDVDAASLYGFIAFAVTMIDCWIAYGIFVA